MFFPTSTKLLRRIVVSLQSQKKLSASISKLRVLCRGDRIRTCDRLVPNQERYRTALRPEWL